MSEIKGLVAFSILMENGNGILDKAPDYIMEKYKMCMNIPDPFQLLDLTNQSKFNQYMKTWYEAID